MPWVLRRNNTPSPALMTGMGKNPADKGPAQHIAKARPSLPNQGKS